MHLSLACLPAAPLTSAETWRREEKNISNKIRTTEKALTAKELVEHEKFLKRYARSLTATQTQADDLLQDSYEQAIKNLSKYRAGTNLRSWLARVMRNLHIDQCRKRYRQPQLMPLEKDSIIVPVKGNQVPRLQLRGVARKISKLESDQQNLLSEVVGKGKSYKDVAGELNIAVGTVKSRLSRIREKIALD